jgi:hypothetical protein
MNVKLLCVVVWLIAGASTAFAQTTSFTYQGRLTDGGTAANGNYDVQFTLFDSLSGGAQVGSPQTINTVAVSNGVFTVSLDFGANAFPGATRFLEISARPTGGGSFTLLTPRQQITSTPYAVRSLNAASADSVPASGVSAGSGNYIQNSASAQPSSNFNISGNGTAAGTLNGSVVNAVTQYNLAGIRVLSNPGSSNLFAGVDAGTANTISEGNSFFGASAGQSNTTGDFNSFFGASAGRSNTTGQQNSFFGTQAGSDNTSGGFNSFFGDLAGGSNTEGDQNAFFGAQAGFSNTIGSLNAFFGIGAGLKNTTGVKNVFIGSEAGSSATGDLNTFVGYFADFINVSPSGRENTLLGANTRVLTGSQFSPNNATAIGANARVDQGNSLVLGSIKGINSATADTNVGIGTTAPTRLLHLKGPGSDGSGNGDLLITGTGTVGAALTFESTGTGGRKYSWISTASAADPGGGALAAFDVTNAAYRMVINSAGNVGIGTTAPTATLSVNGTANKPGGGSWATFSDERLKTIKDRFTPGLNAVMQLQPLRYEYKRDNVLNLKSEGEHIGFSAQAVQKIIPEAVTANDKGYLLVNNDPILWTMLNAIKEQQAQIEGQQKQIVGLKKLICRSRRRAAMCK